jgi:DnaJ-class molecular chaperone
MKTRDIKLRCPAGVKDGSTIRLPGKGAPGSMADRPATCWSHPRRRQQALRTEGQQPHLKVPITYTEAALGTKISVPT